MCGGSGSRHRFLGRNATGRKDPDRGCDDQRPVRAGEHRTERLDDLPIGLAVRLEFREVVIERRVDNAIGGGRAAAQTVEVFQIAAMHLSASGEQRRSAGIGARKPKHLMARRDQFLNDGSADKPGRTGHENAHRSCLHVGCGGLSRSDLSG
jgi:hypothetical protein